MVSSPVWAHEQIEVVMVRMLLFIHTGILEEGSDKYRNAKFATHSQRDVCGPYF